MNTRNIVRRSATSDRLPAPQVHGHQAEVSKLIDVTTCIGCGYCLAVRPSNVPRISTGDNTADTCTLCSDRVGVQGAGVREDLPHRRHRLRAQGGHDDAGRYPRERAEGARRRERRS
ncbi:hypothetical protein V5F53_02230 [Xanthobacter sp. V4C-4]|uniref:hypothetical protein n=1 Tax=Xanthobacter cornucopiae TaxID=3119924 RepID=UPI003727CFC4